MFNLEYIRYAETFCALQVPIYYYVKTKGSLANQSLTISKTIKMKLMVFEYYHQFFKTVLDEEEYERSRLKVYRFLLDAAGDGSVPPPLLSNSRKLGNERMQVSSSILDGEGALYDAFRKRKLLEQYLETAALKNDLTLSDVRLLLALRELKAPCARRDLAELAGLSRGTLSLSLQRLTARELIQVENLKDSKTQKRLLQVSFPNPSAAVFQDLDLALDDTRQISLSGLSPEECAQYEALAARVQGNIEAALL